MSSQWPSVFLVVLWLCLYTSLADGKRTEAKGDDHLTESSEPSKDRAADSNNDQHSDGSYVRIDDYVATQKSNGEAITISAEDFSGAGKKPPQKPSRPARPNIPSFSQNEEITKLKLRMAELRRNLQGQSRWKEDGARKKQQQRQKEEEQRWTGEGQEPAEADEL